MKTIKKNLTVIAVAVAAVLGTTAVAQSNTNQPSAAETPKAQTHVEAKKSNNTQKRCSHRFSKEEKELFYKQLVDEAADDGIELKFEGQLPDITLTDIGENAITDCTKFGLEGDDLFADLEKIDDPEMIVALEMYEAMVTAEQLDALETFAKDNMSEAEEEALLDDIVRDPADDEAFIEALAEFLKEQKAKKK